MRNPMASSTQNNSNNDDNKNNNGDKNSQVSMVVCQDCGREVPEMNLTMHQIRACKGRARAGPPDPAEEEPASMKVDGAIEEHNEESKSDGDHVMPSTDSADQHTSGTGMRRRRRSKRRVLDVDEISDNGDDDDILQVSDVIDLSSDHENTDNETHNSNDAQNPGNNDEWACPQCTLLNPITRGNCEACNFQNPNRPPDRTRSERLIFDSPSGMGFNNMPMSYVGHGALLGGMLGAADSFMRGRSLISGAAEGAMTGVVGGALLNEVFNVSSNAASMSSSENNNPNISEARSSAAMGTPGYPSLSASDAPRNQRARPRSSYRAIQHRGEDGSTTTIIQGGSGSSTRITRRSVGGGNFGGAGNFNDPVLSLLLHSLIQQTGGGGGTMNGIDGMDYEQLLRAFGDGTENLGAQESQINQLPTRQLQNPETDLPEDARQCLICLEDFAAGETRTTMPCLHGFHKECADRWLRTNGSCPICKHRLS